MEQTVLTEEGKKQLEKKLEEYKTVKRPEVIKKHHQATTNTISMGEKLEVTKQVRMV